MDDLLEVRVRRQLDLEPESSGTAAGRVFEDQCVRLTFRDERGTLPRLERSRRGDRDAGNRARHRRRRWIRALRRRAGSDTEKCSEDREPSTGVKIHFRISLKTVYRNL